MSEERHEFHLTSRWTDNSDGDGALHFDWNGAIEYGVPVSTGGKAGRSNPEELLLAAAASCFSITLALLLEKKRLPATIIEMEASGAIIRQPDRTLKFAEIVLRPRLKADGWTVEQRKIALDLAHKADAYCLVSNALRGNVTISVLPELLTD